MLQRSLFQSRAWNAESLGPVGGILRLTPPDCELSPKVYQLGFNRIIPNVGVNGRGRFTMGLRRL